MRRVLAFVSIGTNLGDRPEHVAFAVRSLERARRAGDDGSFDFEVAPVTVRGRLEVGEKSIDGWVMSVYRMESVDLRPMGGF